MPTPNRLAHARSQKPARKTNSRSSTKHQPINKPKTADPRMQKLSKPVEEG